VDTEAKGERGSLCGESLMALGEPFGGSSPRAPLPPEWPKASRAIRAWPCALLSARASTNPASAHEPPRVSSLEVAEGWRGTRPSTTTDRLDVTGSPLLAHCGGTHTYDPKKESGLQVPLTTILNGASLIRSSTAKAPLRGSAAPLRGRQIVYLTSSSTSPFASEEVRQSSRSSCSDTHLTLEVT